MLFNNDSQGSLSIREACPGIRYGIVSNGKAPNIVGAFCLGGVMVILRDCGSLDLGSIPGPGLFGQITFFSLFKQ